MFEFYQTHFYIIYRWAGKVLSYKSIVITISKKACSF